ncbi:MAG: hypothetical protein EOM78_17545, partial [Erysipelotrichia bacterium]|nr:hypothetical protein [Erysipelotrichia bacterium]
MILIDQSTKNQFRIFCKENNIQDMEIAVKYFIVFGGLDIKIDTTKPLLELIEKHILEQYTDLKYEVTTICGGYKV